MYLKMKLTPRRLVQIVSNLIVLFSCTFHQHVKAQGFTVIDGPIFHVQFSPYAIEDLVEGDETVVQMNITSVTGTNSNYKVEVSSRDTEIALVTAQNNLIPEDDVFTSNGNNFTILGEWIGRTTLSFNFINEDTNEIDQSNPDEYDVAVVRPDRIEDDIFEYSLGLIIVINNVGFGCKFDWKIAKFVFSRPLAIIIGVCGQYVVLPLVSTI